MQTFKVTIYDDFFKTSLDGEFEAMTQEQAIEDAKEFYACELGTEPNEINVLSVEAL